MDGNEVTGAATPPMLPDVRIFAFGRKGYLYAAANLAASIKRWAPDVKVVVHVEQRWMEFLWEFHYDHVDEWVELDEADFRSFGQLDPGRLKSRLWDHLPPGEHLYLDADCLCLKDITPLLQALQKDPRNYIAEIISRGDKDATLAYCPWASPGKQAQKLHTDEPRTFYGIQTSWAFIRKDPTDGVFFRRVKHNHDRVWRKDELDDKWGNSMPDELIYGFTCTELNHDPGWDSPVMFYGTKITLDTIDDIRSEHYFMTQYGRIGKGGSVRPHYLEMYDKELVRIYNYFGLKHVFKLNMIAVDKYVDAYKLKD